MSAEICGPLLPSGSFTFIDMFRMHSFWKWFQIAVSMEVGFLLCAFVSGILSSITTDPSCSASAKRFVRLVGQTVECLISSDCRSDCRSVWTLHPTGRTDWPVGRPITLQRRRYYNQLTGHIDLIDIMWAVRLQSVQPVCPTGLTDSRT